MPSVRVRGRYREVRVLPIVRYKELAEFITFHYRELCARLEPTIAVRHKEELAGALVRVLQSTGKAKVEWMLAMGDVGRVGEGKMGAAWGAVVGWDGHHGLGMPGVVGWDGVDEWGWIGMGWMGWDGMAGFGWVELE